MLSVKFSRSQLIGIIKMIIGLSLCKLLDCHRVANLNFIFHRLIGFLFPFV